MAYVQVKLFQTWKIAAFIVAFFSSFSVHSSNAIYDQEYLDRMDWASMFHEVASVKETAQWDCKAGTHIAGSLSSEPSVATQEYMTEKCKPVISRYIDAIPVSYDCPIISSSWIEGFKYKRTYRQYWNCSGPVIEQIWQGSASNLTFQELESCPPDINPNLDYAFDFDDNGKTDCFDSIQIEKLIEKLINDDQSSERCKDLVLDKGNNSGDNYCHTSKINGSSCNVQKKILGDTYYYVGTGSADGGCFTSDDPPFDDSGNGDAKDGCIYSDGINYCKANRDTHCKTIQGAEICDDGCMDDGTNLYCDTNRHPDVGDGSDTDYFDDTGTCSIISASTSKGYCLDMGGTWDDTEDYAETQCTGGSGTCSIFTGGLCGSCIDAGGTWTPDEIQEPSDPYQAEQLTLQNKSNEKLSQIEHGNRVGLQSVRSSINSGTDSVVNAISELGEKLGKKEEKEQYTTSATAPDKTAFDKLFNQEAIDAIKANSVTKQAEIDDYINTVKTEIKGLFEITIPNASGYEARSLDLTQGSFDVGLSRFSDFFKMLSTPIMLVFAVAAAIVILRR